MEPDGSLRSLQVSLARIKETRAALDRARAPRFSAFEAMLPGETVLSRVLRYLLDDRAAHGQESTFLHQFLDLIGCNDCKSRHFHAVTEYRIREGRKIDILLRSRDYVIGIENKPWAGEQDAQCEDYAKDLEWQMPGNWTLVFLAPGGREPKTGGKFRSSIKLLKYEDLAARLSTSCARIEPFLEDFIRYVRQHICGDAAEPNMSEEIDLFLRPEHLDVTLKILSNGSAIRIRLLDGLRDSMLAQIKKDFPHDVWQATETVDFEQACSPALLFFKPQWRGVCGIGFQNQLALGLDVVFGVHYF